VTVTLSAGIAYRGASRFDRKTKIVVLLTGLARGSLNRKTGRVVQAHILVDKAIPAEAARDGRDFAICGDCPRRRTPERGTTCYVSLARGYPQMGKKLINDEYEELPEPASAVAGHFLRVGAYGDPYAVPIGWWMELIGRVSGWTAYTHQWRRASEYRAIAMASCGEAEPALRRETICPASIEDGKRTTCEACRACSGLASPGRDVAIIDHSVTALWARNLGPRRRLPMASLKVGT
jgi:hypothetical protein